MAENAEEWEIKIAVRLFALHTTTPLYSLLRVVRVRACMGHSTEMTVRSCNAMLCVLVFGGSLPILHLNGSWCSTEKAIRRVPKNDQGHG